MSERVLAIDPGDKVSGFVVWDGSRILSMGIEENERLLTGLWIEERGFEADAYLLEMVEPMGKPIWAELIETCVWIGRFWEAINLVGEAHRIGRKAVKSWHCRGVPQSDTGVIQSLKAKYGEKGTKAAPGPLYGVREHIWQALALATYWTETAGAPEKRKEFVYA